MCRNQTKEAAQVKLAAFYKAVKFALKKRTSQRNFTQGAFCISAVFFFVTESYIMYILRKRILASVLNNVQSLNDVYL
jgi:hypothetical protein